jgi:hypothetical protein
MRSRTAACPPSRSGTDSRCDRRPGGCTDRAPRPSGSRSVLFAARDVVRLVEEIRVDELQRVAERVVEAAELAREDLAIGRHRTDVQVLNIDPGVAAVGARIFRIAPLSPRALELFVRRGRERLPIGELDLRAERPAFVADHVFTDRADDAGDVRVVADELPRTGAHEPRGPVDLEVRREGPGIPTLVNAATLGTAEGRAVTHPRPRARVASPRALGDRSVDLACRENERVRHRRTS